MKMAFLSNKIDRKQLNPGDHIYSWRQAYTYAHHGIYVGLGKVIHFTRAATEGSGSTSIFGSVSSCSSSYNVPDFPCPLCEYHARSDGVVSSCLDCFLSGGQLYLYHYGVSKLFFLAQVRGGTCTVVSSDSAEKVVKRSNSLLEKGFGGYHVVKNNCLHLAIYCKTGMRVNEIITGGGSEQAVSGFAVASTVVSVSPLPLTSFGAVPVSCGLYTVYCARGLAIFIGGILRYVTKVPGEEPIDKMGKTD